MTTPEGFTPRNDRIQAALDADPELAGRVKAGLAKMDAEDRTYAMSLATVRKAADLTQVELAQRLGVGQGAVSRIEHSDNLLVSTLLSYLDAAGVQDVTLTATVAGRRVDIDLAEMTRH